MPSSRQRAYPVAIAPPTPWFSVVLDHLEPRVAGRRAHARPSRRPSGRRRRRSRRRSPGCRGSCPRRGAPPCTRGRRPRRACPRPRRSRYAAAVLLRRSHGSATSAAIAPRSSPASPPITAALRLLVADARTATAGLDDAGELDVLGEREELPGAVQVGEHGPAALLGAVDRRVRVRRDEQLLGEREGLVGRARRCCCVVRGGDARVDVVELLLVVRDLRLEELHLLLDVRDDLRRRRCWRTSSAAFSAFDSRRRRAPRSGRAA